jgi:hypothetical protein
MEKGGYSKEGGKALWKMEGGTPKGGKLYGRWQVLGKGLLRNETRSSRDIKKKSQWSAIW